MSLAMLVHPNTPAPQHRAPRGPRLQHGEKTMESEDLCQVITCCLECLRTTLASNRAASAAESSMTPASKSPHCKSSAADSASAAPACSSPSSRCLSAPLPLSSLWRFAAGRSSRSGCLKSMGTPSIAVSWPGRTTLHRAGPSLHWTLDLPLLGHPPRRLCNGRLEPGRGAIRLHRSGTNAVPPCSWKIHSSPAPRLGQLRRLMQRLLEGSTSYRLTRCLSRRLERPWKAAGTA